MSRTSSARQALPSTGSAWQGSPTTRPCGCALADYQRDGRAWVATGESDPDDRPVAYLLVDLVDGRRTWSRCPYVLTTAGGRLGAALLDTASAWAEAHGPSAVTLTTSTQVPWNGPYSARLGFRYLADDELWPGLGRLRDLEAAHGLDRWPRSAMRRDARPARPATDSVH